MNFPKLEEMEQPENIFVALKLVDAMADGIQDDLFEQIPELEEFQKGKPNVVKSAVMCAALSLLCDIRIAVLPIVLTTASWQTLDRVIELLEAARQKDTVIAGELFRSLVELSGRANMTLSSITADGVETLERPTNKPVLVTHDRDGYLKLSEEGETDA